MTGPSDQTGDLPPDDSGGDAVLAAEYVLGLLPQSERDAFELRLDTEPALREEVVYWTEHFADLADTLPEIAPDPRLLTRIEARAFDDESPSTWRQLLPYLLGGLAAASIAALVSFSGLLDTTPEPHLYADLVVDDRGLQLLAHYAPDSETFMVRRDAGTLPADRSLEVWILPASGAAPISVGLIEPETLTSIPVPDALGSQIPGATVAISEEPAGGSPTGAPTGPILAQGLLEIR